jgi:hypothetical protein
MEDAIMHTHQAKASDLIEIYNTASCGRGVFATRRISKDADIETSLAIPIQPNDESLIDRTVIWDYYFLTRPFLRAHSASAHLLLGIASLCNHSSDPNARIVWEDSETGVWGTLRATRDIQPAEEVTIYYTNIEEYVERGLIDRESAYGVAKMSG